MASSCGNDRDAIPKSLGPGARPYLYQLQPPRPGLAGASACLSKALHPSEPANLGGSVYRSGRPVARDITAALLRSCVGVLLLSPDFLASDFIHSEELPPLLEGAEDGSIILLVIPISASNYEMSPLAKYRFAHSPDRPLDRMRKAQRNAALVEITKKIVASAGHRRSRLAWCSTSISPTGTTRADSPLEGSGF